MGSNFNLDRELILSIDRDLGDWQENYDFLFSLWDKLRSSQADRLTISLEGCKFLQQNAIVFLGAMLRWSQQQGKTVGVVLPEGAVKTFLEGNGFLHAFFSDFPPASYYRSIPFREDTAYNHEAYTKYLAEYWLGRGWVQIDRQLRDYITQQVVEAYINVFDHAHSPIGVMTCGQYYKNDHKLKIAMVDFGVGIPTNVRNHLKNPSMLSSDALRWAFQPQTTTKPEAHIARGLGLKLLKEFIIVNDGRLDIYSDNGYARINKKESEVFEDRSTGFQGTLVQVTIRCDTNFYTLLDDAADSQELFF